MQSEQRGTGHAVMCGMEPLADFEGDVAILCGDVPLLEKGAIDALLAARRASGAGPVALLTSVLEANLALVSVTQNEVVKKISAVAAIIALPTFIASVYGMNFEHMPELESRVGYPLALAAMALCALALVAFFRRIDWL